MSCSEALRVQEYFDGELDAGTAAEVERHLETCAECAALLKDLEMTRAALRESGPYYRASDELRASIADALDDESGERPAPRPARVGKGFLWGALSGGGATALAAAFAVLLFLPAAPNLLVDDLTNAHLRSMMSDHLIDVVSSDRHTVKPWFAGHTDVSPPAVDFAKEGYALIGGRADYIDGHRAAVVVYRHGKHVINVFAWIAGDEHFPTEALRNGYNLVFWKSGNIAYCAVSDTGLEEIATLTHLIQNAGAPVSPE
ncbi:MAG: anti-sigma factor [Rhizomicrobium sp.]|jgi:anti-sigma factor RsiW